MYEQTSTCAGYNFLFVKNLIVIADSKAILSAASYVYEVEQYTDATPSTMGQIGTAPFDRVRRRKGIYSRDKNRLFLKQFVEHGPGGVICIKVSRLINEASLI